MDAKQMAKKRTFVSSAQFPSLYNTQTKKAKKAKEETITIKMWLLFNDNHIYEVISG